MSFIFYYTRPKVGCHRRATDSFSSSFDRFDTATSFFFPTVLLLLEMESTKGGTLVHWVQEKNTPKLLKAHKAAIRIYQ